MAPKSSSAKEQLMSEEDEVLQAVILADSFNKRFKPLTTHKPRCLLPICNAPLLDWTFESLALAGVQEIFVVCRSHADQVKTAIKNSKWSKPNAGIKIVPIVTAKETFSPGDAMRDIYTHGIITSDFILVTGDLVSNVRIDEVVREHKERRKTNKDAIMTMVVKESGPKHRTRPRGDSSVFILDPETSECLHYEAVTGYPPKKYANIPREILAEHPEVEVRNDLIDCSIDVCSVEVPSLFQDNFDYGDLRRDFVHGILTSDLLMKNIYCYIAKDGYAARVRDTRSYDSVSKDILSRWTFPLVPDDNYPGGHPYEHLRGNKYFSKGNSVSLSRTCKIGNNTLIGSGSQIADNAQVSASVLGPRCVIGTGSTIRNSYLFEGVVVGANCMIEHSIIGADVQIRENSRVAKGCLIADRVILGPRANVKAFEKLSRRTEESDEDEGGDKHDNADPHEDVDADDEHGDDSDINEEVDSELEEVEANQDSVALARLGADNNAIIWPEPVIDDDEAVDELDLPNNLRLMRIGDDATDLVLSDPGSVTSSESDSESDSDEEDEQFGGSDPSSSTTSLPLNAPNNLVAQADSAVITEFQNEVTQSLERAFAEGHSVDNAAVELKTLRMASNVPLKRVREAVVAAIVNRIKIVEGGNVPQRKEIASVIDRWGGLIDKIGGIDAVETIEVLQDHCASSSRLPLFGQILAALYQDDIVEEDDIRTWHAGPASQGEDVKSTTLQANFKKCWAIGAHMIKQFDEQETDDESHEEDAKVVTANRAQEENDDESDEDESEESEESEKEKKNTSREPPGVDENISEDEEDEDEDDEDQDVKKAPAAITSAPEGESDGSAEEKEADTKSSPVTKTISKDEDDESEEDKANAGTTPSPITKNISEDEDTESAEETGEEDTHIPPHKRTSTTSALTQSESEDEETGSEEESEVGGRKETPAVAKSSSEGEEESEKESEEEDSEPPAATKTSSEDESEETSDSDDPHDNTEKVEVKKPHSNAVLDGPSNSTSNETKKVESEESEDEEEGDEEDYEDAEDDEDGEDQEDEEEDVPEPQLDSNS